jgi:hypothetical protein
VTAVAENRRVPVCRVQVDGQPLRLDRAAALVRVETDLDEQLFARCTLLLIDPRGELISGDLFGSGASVKVEMGFPGARRRIFAGEVVALEPSFLKDKPPSLRVVCFELLHRLALSQMTRSLHDVDDNQTVQQIAQSHGLQGEGPRVLPSPAAGPSFVQLVSDIFRIQAIADDASRLRAWSEYATSAPSAEGRKAALRSLAGPRASWPMVQPTWLKVLHTPSAPPEVRIFAFLLLAHLVAEQRWPHSLSGMVALAIDAFAEETDGPVALGFTDGLLLLHAAATRDPQRFPGVARAVVNGLRKRETLVPAADPRGGSLNEAYQQLRGPLLAPETHPEK